MAYQSLYRRYRSKNFEEIKGQPHVTSALRTAVAEGRHGHAYLFSGPRGTGKTSTARVVAKALNCEQVVNGEPCGVCDSCVAIDEGKSFDLHELDAASNNKVDDIRDLIAKVQLGSPGRTKVYILDEVHMLSTGAENALLKTLEEPPEHVVFVLATTEPHKVVPTIRSRTQHFEFHLLPADELADHVAYVVEDAGLDVDADGIEYALAQGGGSARDTLSALDLVAAAGGVPAGSNVGIDLVRVIGAGDAAEAIRLIQEALVNGLQPRIIGEQLLNVIRDTFLAVMGAGLDHLSDTARSDIEGLAAELKPATLTRSMEMVGQALIEIRQAPDPRVPLEVAVLRLARRDGTDTDGLLQRIEALETQLASGVAPVPTQAPPVQAAPTQAEAQPPAETPAQSSSAQSLSAQSTPAQSSPAQSSSAQSTPAQPLSASSERQQSGPAGAQVAEPQEQQTPPPVRRSNRSAKPANSENAAGFADNTSQAPARRPRSPRAARPSEPAPEAGTRQPEAASSAPPTEAAPTGTSPTGTSPTEDQPTGTSPARSEPAVSPEPSPVSAAAPSKKLTVASAQEALAKCLDQVSQKARVRFKGGTVSKAEGSIVVFAAPNQMHCNRCIEVKQDVEAALSEHFATAITVDVIVDGDALGSTVMDPTKIDRSRQNEPEAVDDIGPVSELADADSTALTGVDRLTKAFPGSKVIEHNSLD